VLGVVISCVTAYNNKTGFFTDPVERAFNSLAFFTVQSNLIVAFTCTLLALRPDRSSVSFRTARLTGVVCITVTGIVYHVALAGLLELDSWDLVGDQLVHTVVPVLTVVGWLAFGPRRAVGSREVGLSLIFPVAWLTFTLARGAAVKFYPYPFVDVTQIGYGKALVNCLWVSLLLLGLAAGARAIDRALPGGRPPEPVGGRDAKLEPASPS
jgi:hypothetical protein